MPRNMDVIPPWGTTANDDADIEMKDFRKDIYANTKTDSSDDEIIGGQHDAHGVGTHKIELASNSANMSSFLLLNTMIGSGILNQPFVFQRSGILGAFLGFAFSTVAIWYALVILTAAGIHANILEYSGLAKKAFGKNGERIIDFFIVFGGGAAIMGYVLIIGNLMSGLLSAWGCEGSGCGLYSVSSIAVAVFVMPLCLFRHFGHLAILSIFSIVAISLVLALVIVGGPIVGKEKGLDSGDVKIFDMLGSIQSIGSIVFALSCAPANFQAFVSTEAKSRNLDSWIFITLRTVIIGALMCLVMGLVGYLSFRSTTYGDILKDFTEPGFAFFKIMVIIHLIMYIPVDFVVMRYSFVIQVFGIKAENLATIWYVPLSIIMLTSTVVLVLILQSQGVASGKIFSLILDFTGGIGGSVSSFILPAAIYLKIMPEDSEYYTKAKVMFVLGWFVMIAVVTATCLNLSEGN